MLLRTFLGLVLVGAIASGVGAQSSPGPRIVRSQAPLIERGELFDNNAEYLAMVSRESPVFSLAWSPDGKSLAIGTKDGAVHVWEMSSSQELIRIQAVPPVESVTFSPDGRRLAVASKSKGVSVWDPRTGEETLLKVPGNISAVSYRPDGQTLACGFVEGHIDLWNLQDNTRARRLDGHTGRVNSMAWSPDPDGKILASGSSDGTIRLWYSEGGEETRSLKGHDNVVNTVSWARDGQRLASGSSDGTVRVWSVATGQVLARLDEDTQGVGAVAWTDDGKSIVSGNSDHTVRLWDLSSKEEVLKLDHKGRVNALAVRGGMIASGSGDGTVRLWDVGTGREIRRFEGHASAITAATWSEDTTRLAVVYENRDIRLWDLNANTEEWRIEKLSDSAITAVTLGPGGTRLAVGFEDGNFSIWNTDTLGTGGIRQPLAFGRHRGQRVSALAWSHNGRLLASGDWKGRIYLWDLAKGTAPTDAENELVGHTDDVLALAWSTDDKTLVSASSDGNLLVWSFADDGMQVRWFEGSPKSVSALALDADGKTIVMGMNNGTLRYWDLESNVQRTAQKFSGRFPMVVGVSSGGRVVASTDRGSQKGLLQVWIRSEKQSTYQPTYRLISGKRDTWVVCQSSKKCLRHDDGTLLVIQGEQGILEPVSLGAKPSDLELLSVPGEVLAADGEASSFNLRVRNLGSQVFWVNVRQVESDTENSRLRFYPPSTQVKIDPEEEADLSCFVSLASDYEGPRRNTFPLRLEVASSNAPPLALEPVRVRGTVASLKWVEARWSQDGDDIRLLVSISNVGDQVLPPTRFFAEVSDLEESQQATNPSPIEPGATSTVTFVLPPELGIRPKGGMRVTVTARKPSHPVHQWVFSNRKIAVTRPSWKRSLLLIVLIGISAVAYFFRSYRHPIVRRVLGHPETLPSLHPDEIVRVDKLLTTQQMRKVLSSVDIQRSQLDFAVKFFDESRPDIRSSMLAERLISGELSLEKIRENLWKLPLGSEFLLSIEDCLLYLPDGANCHEDEWDNLMKVPEVQEQITLLICADFDHQERFHQYADNPKNLVMAPSPGQIRDLLMRPEPERYLAKLIASQVRLSRISPYQTAAGAAKDSIFFGRRDIISHIMHRAPFNYFIVGGRQVGKSSLLKALYRRYQSLPEEVECHYMVLNDSELLKRLARTVGLADASLNETLHALSVLGKEKRRLMLIDEADAFIVEDRKNDYKILSRLRSLSEEGSCYFILAGFWELYDAVVLDYHSPLKNFGETVTIGALETDACRELATKPMRAMGISYSSPELVARLIRETGRRANLLTMLCNEMLMGLMPGNQHIEVADVDKAIGSPAISRALEGWSSLAGNDLADRRIGRMVVFATIRKESFTLSEILNIFQSIGFGVNPEDVERSLHRLVLAFILREEGSSYFYQVPLFRSLILREDPDVRLRHELRAWNEQLRSGRS